MMFGFRTRQFFKWAFKAKIRNARFAAGRLFSSPNSRKTGSNTKEQIQEIDNQVAELEKEKEDLLIDTNILKRPDGTDFYLPKDPEKAELIKQTLKELKFLKQQFIKDREL